ncbi:MAG: glycosyltransferase family 4 protein [Burkholderiales bacterium]|nr:glycosyltransferase family 4 protein [Burkholderiales bacterium]MCW5603470.1 glycosyltransferase family 4 protein [Burkholderiales bacterium]
MVWLAVFIALITFTIAALAVGWLARGAAARIALDKPNARSLHTVPVPRTGGIGLLTGIAAGWLFAGVHWPWAFWSAMALIIAVSLLDDLRGLSATVRLAAHLLAAALAVLALLPEAGGLTIAIAVLLVAWMCNLYNFMDGSDGLAGGMACSGFLCYAIAAAFAGSTQFAQLNLAIAAAAAGFLVHNFHPARIFLGDAGSVPLGFLAATLGLTGWQQHDWTWWFPLLVFAPFIVDASVTLARRVLSGARFWEAHRDHYYQRLVQIGIGHRRTALLEYALMAGSGALALWAMTLRGSVQYGLLAAIAVVYLMLLVLIERAWRRAGVAHD